ncbi:MAG: hypothetical protein US31_C0002G0019 [Berkelbacteria bacterium GW2011_GWA1_36_9]|uniref:Uncharacterized protein n=1 Tax=Berkelbacteria bacterium GW2011_GWA1_36_9 TaxID=1618331 RepID=A0A0G0I347_9BACT|nr:MAG: hypothetical protein US31_C0002G0019 [Berkelbacteria bacterium GW2011_GWA1_36_9]
MKKTIAWILTFLIWGALLLIPIIKQDGILQIGAFFFLGIAFYYIEAKKTFDKKSSNQPQPSISSTEPSLDFKNPTSNNVIAKSSDIIWVNILIVMTAISVIIGIIMTIVSLSTHDNETLPTGIMIGVIGLIFTFLLIYIRKRIKK